MLIFLLVTFLNYQHSDIPTPNYIDKSNIDTQVIILKGTIEANDVLSLARHRFNTRSRSREYP